MNYSLYSIEAESNRENAEEEKRERKINGEENFMKENQFDHWSKHM